MRVRWKWWSRGIAILATAAVLALPAQVLADDGGSGSSALCAALGHASAQTVAVLQATPSLASLLKTCGTSSDGGSGSHKGLSKLCAAVGNLPAGADTALSSLLKGCASTGVQSQTQSNGFSDLAGYGWAQGAIDQLAQMKVLRGVGHGHFDPGGTLTRAQFATLIMRVFNLQAPASGGATFVDVPAGFWAAGAIAAAAPYMTEYKTPGGLAFEPDLPASRIDVAATIGELEVAQGSAQLPSASAAASVWSGFSDGTSVPPGIAEAAAVAVQLGIMKGYPNGTFGVADPVSRAQAAVLLQRVLSTGETMGGGSAPTQTGAPTVTSITPATGPTAGGTLIAIAGTGFTSGATVTVGGVPATSVTVVTSTLITARTPAGSGTVEVSVTTAAGASLAGAGTQFTYGCTTTQTVSGTVYCAG